MYVPRLAHGWGLALETLLDGVAPRELALVGNASERWGERPYAPLLSTQAHSAFAPYAERVWHELIALEIRRGAPALARKMPRLQRVLGTFDRYIGLADALAREARAELWLYAIDDHTQLEYPRIARWRTAALRRATRVFALSPEMAEHLHGRYGVRDAEVLPPLTDVPAEPAPMPRGDTLRIVFVGNLADYQWPHLLAIAEAARARGGVELVAVVPEGRAIWLPGELPAPWRVVRGKHRDVARHVAEAHVGLILLQLSDRPEDGMQVAFPAKLTDYLAGGRPVLAVVTDRTCVARVIREEGIGWCVPATDRIAGAVEAIAGLPRTVLASMGAKAHAYARERVDTKTVGAAFRERLIGGRSA